MNRENRISVLDVGFDAVTLAQALEAAQAALHGDKAQYVVTPNPEIVWECRKNPELTAAVDGAMLVLPDGIGVIYGAKIMGTPLPGKVTGVDFGQKLAESLSGTEESLFLLGAKPGIAEMAADKLLSLNPQLVIAGTADGYFTDDDAVIEKINASGAKVLFVCLGAPKQELWMRRNAEKLNVRLMAGLGGSLDVFAGTVRRAPEAWQKLGLEWFYRLIKQPSRIKRQIRLPLFMFAVIGRRLFGKKH